ncbi:hypothetical protein SELMODRAFT_441685 [Selaginella moellendorffii]|uniref:RING-type domain-containing protein n=1 Tax=Selaginella moellendorffii TaxID=88036 RepID=D8RM21_SELML|nr:RING-H2 finger protein ATL8 [Selaginella moellendorffii]EFJ27026.1 hypothetical protein SELMODRAFT_441685 [Selaginella moellendorffii]|eukprot:XP_002972109.1 RING-H2 finger protein ATL8 [Selaginella moellendorffii]
MAIPIVAISPARAPVPPLNPDKSLPPRLKSQQPSHRNIGIDRQQPRRGEKMARFSLFSLAGEEGAPDSAPMIHNHLYRHHKPFHLTTLTCVAIVLCGMGASLSIMVLFWCFSSRRRGRQQGEGSIGPSVGAQERQTRAKATVGLLPIVSSDDARRADECCAVCLTDFGRKIGGGEEESEDLDLSDREIQSWEIRALPGCGHCFHTQCIQLWLCSYLTCPLCRRGIAADDHQPCAGSIVANGASSSGSLCDRQQHRRSSRSAPSSPAPVATDCECG